MSLSVSVDYITKILADSFQNDTAISSCVQYNDM